MERRERARTWRRWRPVAAAALVVAVALPAVTGDDSFPLSTYPMYASDRDRVATIATASAVDADGRPVRLSIGQIAATDDPLIAASRVANAITAGRADDLCRTIAARAPERAVRIEVVRERHDVVDLVRDEASLLGREVVATCDVAT